MATRTSVGIAIEPGAIQAVELTADGERLVVRRAVCEPLRYDSFVEGEINEPAEIAEAIRHVCRRYKLSPNNLCVALGGRRSLARVIEIAPAGEGDAEQLLGDRIARYRVYEQHEAAWQATPVRTEEESRRVFLAASADAAEVAAILPPLRKLGIFLLHLEPHALSTIRALAACDEAEPRPTILVSLRNQTVDFLIVRGDRPLLLRSLDSGATDLSMRPDAVDSLAVEARRAVEYCREQFPDETPRLWMCVQATDGLEGATVLQAQLRETLQDIEVGPPPAWPELAPDAEIGEGAEQPWAAVGAAMVAMGRYEAVEHLNLVPPEWPVVQRVQKHLIGVAASIAGAILITAAVATTLRVVVRDVAQRAEAASIRMQANTANVKTTGTLKQRAAEAIARANLWEDVRSRAAPFDWVGGLRGVMGCIPPGVRVRELQFRRGILRIHGEAKGPDRVHEFVQRLSVLEHLEEANIERLVRAPEGAHPAGRERLPTYTIKCRFVVSPAPELERREARP